MEGYRKTSYATYILKYHLVWITKYRKPVLAGKIAERGRELIRIVCKNNEVEILAGHISKEHVHLLVSAPPHLSVSKLVQYIKGYSSNFGVNICGHEGILPQAVVTSLMK